MKQVNKKNTVQFQLNKIESKKTKKRKPVDDKKIIIRDQTAEIISKAFNIAEFHYAHKKDQKNLKIEKYNKILISLLKMKVYLKEK